MAAHSTFDYKGNNAYVKPHFRSKLQPDKSYGNGLGTNTIHKVGADRPNVGEKFFNKGGRAITQVY